MNVYGVDAAEQMAESDGFLFKLIANESGGAFFPRNTEHRDVKQPGLSYEDDSAGNALAAMIKPGFIEFRFHKSFSDERVRKIAQTRWSGAGLLANPARQEPRPPKLEFTASSYGTLAARQYDNSAQSVDRGGLLTCLLWFAPAGAANQSTRGRRLSAQGNVTGRTDSRTGAVV